MTWEPDTEYDDIAEQGAYVFTPVLPDSYTCAKGVDLPEIYVRIGSVNAVLANDPNDENNDGYHDGDVAAIIAMIDGNGLLRDKDTPGNWKGITSVSYTHLDVYKRQVHTVCMLRYHPGIYGNRFTVLYPGARH